MFGLHGWRPLTVALLVSGTVFLPQGIAAAAVPPDSLPQPFVAPAVGAPPAGGSAATDPSSVAGFQIDGGAAVGIPASAPAPVPTVAPAAAGPRPDTAGDDRSPAGVSANSSATVGPSASDVGPNLQPGPQVPGSQAQSQGPQTPQGQGTQTQGPQTPQSQGPQSPQSQAPQAPAQGPQAQPQAGATTAPTAAPNGTEWSTTGPSPWDDTPPASATPGTVTPATPGTVTPDPGSATRGQSSDDAQRDSASGSARSGESSDDSDGSHTSRRGSDGYNGPTSADPSLGAAACPSTAGGGGATSASGSVVAGAAPAVQPVNPNIPAAASVTDVGTATQATNPTFASPNAGGSVAGTVLDAVGATAARAAGSANMPADVINLAQWYLTLPTGQQGSPDTIEGPNLERFANQFFKLNPARDGVVFSANADGVTTKNSHYPRSELREMDGNDKASWSNTSGSHTLDVCEAFTKLPSAKPEVVGVQIHDAKDDVMQIRLEGQKLMAQYNNGKSEAVLDDAYRLGTPYNVRITAADGKVDVLYNGQKRAELPLSGSGWYWKVGAYVQSNGAHGDGADSTGEVTVYSLNCAHQ